MKFKNLLLAFSLLAGCTYASAQTGNELPFQKWALTPPMGWNSWDCYGPTVVEDEVKANADYMAEKLLPCGWEYVVVDIRWFVENDKAGGYNQTDPIYVYDEYGRYTPALNRFPSAAGGVGFRALADYVHSKGLKFGIHLMRGIPKKAVEEKLPVKGTAGITADMIANNDSTCTWLRDNWKVDCTKPGAQEYYNSCFDMYADWGVDFVKIDDLSRPYHTGEIQLIRNAIDQCGRPIVLSMSPGETPIEEVDHVKTHANMWRTVDDFWDNWSQLNYQFQICEKWAPYVAPGTWADADMLPLGKISIRGERGNERWTNFTPDEQYTMMNLWTIFKSPLMFGGDLPQNDEATNALLTNRDVLYMHSHSANNRQLSRDNDTGLIVWAADDPANGDKFVALFNTGGSQFVNPKNALYRSGTISYLTTGHSTDVDVALPAGTRRLALVVTDGGDGFDCDHADWINPVVTLADGTTLDLTTLKYEKATTGWGDVHINSNIEGGTLKVNGTPYSTGIATHANSVIVYNLPSEATGFKALAGIDNTGSDQGSKSSVEFLVYNYDPTNASEAPAETYDFDATLNLTDLGFAPGQKCEIVEMWNGTHMGQFSDSEFTVHLNPHQSALYRVSPTGRTGRVTAKIAVDGTTKQSKQPFDVIVTVEGGEPEGAYVQLLCNGNIVGTMPLDADGRAVYKATLLGGEYKFKANYSGTTEIKSASTPELKVTVEGDTEDIDPFVNRLRRLVEQALSLDPANIAGGYRAPLAEAIETVQPIEGQTIDQLKENIALLEGILDNAVLSVGYMKTLASLVAETEAFLPTLSEGDIHEALVSALEIARSVYDGYNTLNEDLVEQINLLRTALSDARLQGVPAEGCVFDVTERLKNPSFEEGTTGWTTVNSYQGNQDVRTWSDRPAAHGTYFICVVADRINSLQLYQVTPKLPAGYYTVEASLRNTDGRDYITDQHLFALVNNVEYESEPLATIGGENNNDWTRLSITDIKVEEGQRLRFGVKATGDGESKRGWFHADHFKLYYSGLSGNADAVAELNIISITPSKGCVIIESSTDTVLGVYNLSGVLIDNIEVRAGRSTHSLGAGCYIIAGNKILVD